MVRRTSSGFPEGKRGDGHAGERTGGHEEGGKGDDRREGGQGGVVWTQEVGGPLVVKEGWEVETWEGCRKGVGGSNKGGESFLLSGDSFRGRSLPSKGRPLQVGRRGHEGVPAGRVK